jgi:hypothetical protein
MAGKPSRQDVKDKYYGKALTAQWAGDDAEADKNASRWAKVHNNTNSGKVSEQGVAEDWIDDDAAEPLARYFADLYYGDFSATYKVKLTSHIYQAIQNGELSIDQLKADIDMLEKEKGIKEAYTPSPTKPFRNPPGYNKQGTGIGNKLAQQTRDELASTQPRKGTPVPAKEFAKGIEKDLQKAMNPSKIQVKKNKGVAEGVRGTAFNRGQQDAVKGVAKDQNPYFGSNNGKTPAHAYDWEAGWEDAEATGKIQKQVNEFAPTPERDDSDEVPSQILKLANRWWNAGDKQPQITNVLRSLGWTIGQVESEDDAVQMTHNDGTTYFISADDFDPEVFEAKAKKQRLDPKCWSGYHKDGTQIKGGVRVNKCVKNESTNYWTKLQNERSTKLNSLVNELKASIK